MFGGISKKEKRFNKRCCCLFVCLILLLLFFSFAVGNSCLNFEVSLPNRKNKNRLMGSIESVCVCAVD